MGFSITSPHLGRVKAGLSKVKIELVVRDSAVVVAQRLVDPLRKSFQAAGASSELVADIRVHDGHLNDLVMRNRGARGDVIVGVGGESRSADEAEELEWGGLYSGPKAPVRLVAARSSADVHRMWSNEMTRALDRAVKA